MTLPTISEKTASILIGPPLEGKTDFINELIKTSIKQTPIIYLTTDKTPEEIKKNLLKKQIFFTSKNLKFVDCYSLNTGDLKKDTEDIKRVSGPLALNEISIALSNLEAELFKQKKTYKIIFDSLSTLLMYSSSSIISRFIQVVISKMKNANGSIIFALEEGMHDQKDVITLQHLMSSIIYVKEEAGLTTIKATGLKGFENWQPLYPNKESIKHTK